MVADVAGAGPAVVALHGQPGTAADWAAVVPLLRQRCLVVTPDRPGYGRTGGRATGFGTNAAAVVELLDRLAIPHAVIVGHSWGGGAALALAAAAPDRVTGLVLVASVSPWDHPSMADRLLAVRPVGLVLARLALGAAGRALAHPAVRARAAQRVSPLAADNLARAWRQGGMAGAFSVEQRALMDELPGLAGAAAGVETPIAVVAGSADRIVPPASAEALAGHLKSAQLTWVPGAGHLLPFDHPEAIADAVVGVLRRAER